MSALSTSYAIIIPAYNEAEELPATLAAVRRAMAAQDIPGESIVVDNHSSDNTASVAKAGGADRVVYEPVNQIARARNAGAAATTAEFLIFVDADTRIETPLLTKALHLLRGGLCVGGGAVVRFEGETSGVGRFAGEHIKNQVGSLPPSSSYSSLYECKSWLSLHRYVRVTLEWFEYRNLLEEDDSQSYA